MSEMKLLKNWKQLKLETLNLMYNTSDTPSPEEFNHLVNTVIKLIEAGNEIENLAV